MTKKEIPLILPKWMQTLVLIGLGFHKRKVAQIQDMTYAHVHNVVEGLLSKGLLYDGGKDGRKRVYALTNEGRKVYSNTVLFLKMGEKYFDEEIVIFDYIDDRELENIEAFLVFNWRQIPADFQWREY